MGIIFRELLAIELEYHQKSDGDVQVADYEHAFPERRDDIRRVFSETLPIIASSATSQATSAETTKLITADDTGSVCLHDANESVSPNGAGWDDDATIRWDGTEPLSDLGDMPERFGRYQLIRLLGRGGMGAVYLAYDPRLDRHVAVKVPEFGSHTNEGQEAAQRFYREARSMASVQHPNLCPIYDFGEIDGRPYLTMAYVAGRSLAKEIAESGPINASEAVGLVHLLALAMQAVHDAGIVHRDLKPSNVMIDKESRPLITDFGLASRDRQGEADLTHSGAVIGSPAYMAPEQVRGAHDQVGPRTDVYSLGVILYQLLCGRRPYEGPATSVLGQVTAGIPPKRPSELVDVDPKLESVCLRAMAHDARDRFKSAGEFALALEPFAMDRTRVIGSSVGCAVGNGLRRSVPDRAVKHAEPQSADLPQRKLRRSAILGGIAVAATIVVLSILLVERFGPFEETETISEGSPPKLSTDPPPEFVVSARLLHHDLPTYRAQLGHAVAMDGEYAVVGARGAFVGESRRGAAYVLVNDQPGGWKLHATLRPDEDLPRNADFGRSVAIAGDRVIVGALKDQSGRDIGAAYIFVREGGEWRQEQKLVPPEVVDSGQFATEVAISQRHVAIRSQTNSGIIHIYERDEDDHWNLEQTIRPPGDSNFKSLAMDGGQLFVLKLSRKTQQPLSDVEVLIFNHAQDVWGQPRSLVVRRQVQTGALPVPVAVDRGRLVVGMPMASVEGSSRCGVAHVFRWDGETWVLQQQLCAKQPVSDERFGYAIKISDSHVFVSSAQNGGRADSGAVYVFEDRDGSWVQQQRLESDDTNAKDRFGQALALDGKRAIIAAPNDCGLAMLDGELHFLECVGQTWQPATKTWRPPVQRQGIAADGTLAGIAIVTGNEFAAIGVLRADTPEFAFAGAVHVFPLGPAGVPTTIRAPVPVAGADFGYSLASQATSLVVGAPGRPGAAHVFEETEGGWQWRQELTASGESNVAFAQRIALDGNYLAISASPRSSPGAQSDRPGSVHLFTQRKNRWQHEQRIQANDAAPLDRFGSSLALRGDTLLIGALGASPSGKASGAAYLFRREGQRWRQFQKLTASNGAPAAHFGTAVALGHEHLIVGAPKTTEFGNGSGSVYVFHRQGVRWELQQQIFAKDASHGSYFGSSVALQGNRLLIGADNESSRAPEGGAAYLFYFDGEEWRQHQKLAPSKTGYKQHFGRRVSLRGDEILIGASGENNNAGAAYLFRARRSSGQ